MGHIWNEYKDDKYYYISALSPYLETWDNSTDSIGVNIDIRLDKIIFPHSFIGDNDKINDLLMLFDSDDRYKDVFNLVCHFIAQIDMLQGLTSEFLIQEIIKHNIYKGRYGDKSRNIFNKLEKRDADNLCRYIAKYELKESREIQLDAAIKCLFNDVQIYREKSTEKTHVCINSNGTKYNRELFELICYFLKDVGTEVEAYWIGEHFGIIGIDETMQVDSIALL